MKKIRNWTDEQIKLLLDNYDNYTVRELAKIIGKSESSITLVAKKFGLSKQPHKAWSIQESEYLQNNYLVMAAEDMAKSLNRSVASVTSQLQRLGYVKESNWSVDEVQYLISNYSDNNYSSISKALGRSEGAIRAKCFDLNLVKNDRWTEGDEEYLKKIYYTMPTKDIAVIMNRTPSAVQIKAKKLGLKKYPYHCNYRFFESIDTEEKAYWLGFLSADGWISKNEESGAGVVGVELQYGDIKHLRKFNKCLEGNYKITDRWRPCSLSDSNKLHHMCCLRIFSIDMYNDLANLGFTNDKSYTMSIPEIEPHLLRHYMRGYFDGDGCLSIGKQKSRINYSCSIASASRNIIDDFNNILESIDIDSINIILRDKEGFAPLWILYVNNGNNNNKIRFLNYLYKDATIYLDRKYTRYQKVLKHYNDRSPRHSEMSGSSII